MKTRFYLNQLTADSFDNNKSYGPNSIPTDVLKLIKNNICHPLKEIINLSFTTGIYPTQLKLAKVIPTFKNKGDPLLVSIYRPISLLSNVNKIFERIVHQRLYTFLNKYNCICELQFGFRAQHSTNHALLSLTEKIREALDSKGGKFACGVFIDLQKACDTVHGFIQGMSHPPPPPPPEFQAPLAKSDSGPPRKRAICAAIFGQEIAL